MKFKPQTCKAQLAVVAALTLAVPSFAQQYPSRPVRPIVPFAPGGTTDILARTLGQALGANLGAQVISDKRAGASGKLGTEIGAKAPDGYILLLGVISPLAINVTLFGAQLPYNPDKDFAPISLD
jgi:tripartite-type tricarboxylate transporter receptor subunit TctC